ncbi:MAG: peptidase M20 [Candidatus Riflebacteria bacterium HGW-Riflebacteria-2]|nr:MAG: peptidase M20 [Candidatus Riflebacteria bacterium HGW-Riflebacteria-2]
MHAWHRPASLLQKLIQFDTSNPPGNELACITFVEKLLRDAGIDTMLLAKSPERPNLIARLKGQGSAPPLLLYGHVDVAVTSDQQWQHPPFAGKIVDDFVWGRGALDMKGGVAMMLTAFLRAKADGLALPGDVILALVCDEEAGSEYGAKFLVEEHPGLFKDVRYAIGEFGGFTFAIAGKTFYPIQVAEKQMCWFKATVRGAGGHGSMPVRGGAMAKLARFLQRLDSHRLPVHITPVAREMISRVAAKTGGLSGVLIRLLNNPLLTDRLLDLMGERALLFDSLLHNTVCPTVLKGGERVNVIPGEISVGLDGRLLPGFRPEIMLSELCRIVGNEVEFELMHYCPGPGQPDMGLFAELTAILRDADPDCEPIPLLLSGVTDARFFSQLGIQTYGFLPMPLPVGFDFSRTIHAADERIPVAALDFGANAIYRLLSRFGNTRHSNKPSRD